jgi:hypothetical protein
MNLPADTVRPKQARVAPGLFVIDLVQRQPGDAENLLLNSLPDTFHVLPDCCVPG